MKMKTLACWLALSGIVTPVVAAPYNSLDHTCLQVYEHVQEHDGDILATGPDIRASIHSSYCSTSAGSASIQPAYARTKDEQYCFVGYYCDCALFTCPASHNQ